MTDTNQASEDELGKILNQSYKHIAYSFISTLPPELKYCYSETAQTLDYEKEFNYTKAAIQAIIRTEKLKLLAAVRERVVGEDTTYEGHTMNWAIEHHNHLRAEQRENLAKLEAEL